MQMNDDFESESVQENWYEDNVEGVEETLVTEYDVTSLPNDFNIKTIFDFMESGAVRVPAFQRNYVWDIKRASKLIESIIIGLPIPQIFLYEDSRNRYLVIDGQQRLMSVYYFIKQRFPRKEKRAEIRKIYDENGGIPNEILEDDQYFVKFNLQLSESVAHKINPLHRLNYSTLGDLKTTFDLRTIRNIMIRQTSPSNDDSSIYEVFNRLNTGGVNLRPQEIRASMYHSKFYEMLYRVNLDEKWRSLIGLAEPDLHMKDIEILLRSFATLVDSESYKSSLRSFINSFSRKAKSMNKDELFLLESLFLNFLGNIDDDKIFRSQRGKFNVSLYEAAFFGATRRSYSSRKPDVNFSIEDIRTLEDDRTFRDAASAAAGSKENYSRRLGRALEIVK